MLSVLQLGAVDYATALQLQRTLVELRHDNKIPNTLLLLEHPPVITLGRNAVRGNILASPELLARHGVEVFECDRGGDVTYHGPGQLVGYPIFDLRSFRDATGQRKTIGAVEFVRRLEEVLIRTCADFGVATERVPKLTGVWTQAPGKHSPSPDPTGFAEPAQVEVTPPGPVAVKPGHEPEQAKIAAIGVHISRGITSHGFAFNVSPNLEHFKFIVPCGIATKPVTSLSKQTGLEHSLDAVAESVARHFGRVFHSQVLWLETLDALLGRAVGVPVKAPEIRKLHGDDTFWA